MTRYAIVADLNRCVGCQTCTSACKHANNTAPGVQWRKVLDFETGAFPTVNRAFVPVGCMHCDEPSCRDVCPTTATRKRDDGIVTIDYDLCIGCAYCAVACPYQARSRVDLPSSAYGGKAMRHEALREDPARLGVAQKCTLCVDLIDAGLAKGLVPGVDAAATPACVSSCIAGALTMGDLDDPDSNVAQLLRSKRHFRMHEELGNGPNIHYLYDGEIGDVAPPEAVPYVAEPVGLASVSPRLQTKWDWRAAANFVFGGTGTGLMAMTTLAALTGPAPWAAVPLALIFVMAGLICIWFEIGRPWRFLNVYLNPRTSWMTREAMAALPFFGFGALSWLLVSPALLALSALSGLAFLYCQARILRAAKGIPAWRHPAVVQLIVTTGLTEGAGALAIVMAATGTEARAVALALAALVGLRVWAWTRYRGGLQREGAPTGAFAAFDRIRAGFSAAPQALVAAAALAAAMVPAAQPVLLVLAGLGALLTGWEVKHVLITRAAFDQGYALNRMPARGAGKSSPGIKPGWVRG